MVTAPVFDRYGYGPVAAVYDELAGLYSWGLIDATKRKSIECLHSGDRVFFPGVGRGEEAVEAARLGARITGLDVSSSMLTRLRSRLGKEGLEARLLEADVSTHRPGELYDVVIANYFLNLYEATRASAMLVLLGRLLRPGGRLVISDFARPTGGMLGCGLTEIYYRPVNWIAWAFGLCAMHPILDYARLLDPKCFRIVSEDRFSLLGGENPAYVSIVAERLA